MKSLKIGIASYEKMKARTKSIAQGWYAPGRSEPKVWFTSMESFARVLSDRNRALLELIAQVEPESITELASLSGREKSNLSRTLKTLEQYGLVRLKKCIDGKVTARVPYSDSVLDIPIVMEGTTRTVATPM